MSKKLRSLLSFIASTCIGLLILAYMTRNITTVIITGLIVYTILFTYLIFELINSEKENKKLQEQINQQKNYNRQISQNIWDLEQWKTSVYAVIPDIDEKLEENKARDIASEFDTTYRPLAKLVIDFSDFDKYYEAVRAYNNLPPRAKLLVSINISQIQENYQKMLNTQMVVALNHINHGLSKYKPVAGDYDNWQRLIDYYENLPMSVQQELETNKYILIKDLYDGFVASKDDKLYKESIG